MKKIVRYCFLFLFIFLFMNISNVSALSCSDISTEISNYNKVQNDIKNTDCSNTKDSKIVNTCNKNYQAKSEIITTLYKYKVDSENRNLNCTSQVSQIDSIVKENQEECSLLFGDLLTNATKVFMGLFYILGPILVILFGSLDYTKAVVANDAKELKKATNAFVRRIVALLLIFLSPAIVNLIINLNTSQYNLSGDALTCNTKHIIAQKEVKIETIIPDTVNAASSKSTKKSSKSGLIKGDYDGYMIRNKKPTMNEAKYYNPSAGNTGQCVWYAQGRAFEILNTVKISDSYRKKAINALASYSPNAKEWWPARNVQYSMFGSSNDINKPKEGSVIVWGACSNGTHQFGHVGIIEKVYTDKSGKVTAVDYTEGWTNTGSCPNSNMSCATFRYNTKKSLKDISTSSGCEPFLGYIYLLD